MGESEFMVRVERLRKSYEALVAVDDISFDIRRGEIFGLLGPNGAGKTTTISILAGILASTSGKVQLAGQDFQRTPAMKRLIGTVPQDLAIYLKLTGEENLRFFGELYGMTGTALLERVQAMLALVGLTDRGHSRADTYSGGMKRRLNLAAGLMHNPQLLLLDEPTVGVDPQSRNHIFEGVRALNREGLTILYTSHYMEEVQALCDRVGIMDRGHLIACDTVPNLIAAQGQAVIELGLGIAQPDFPLISRLESVEPVSGVYVFEQTEATAEAGAHSVLHIRSPQPNHALPGLVSVLNALDVPLLSLSIKQPNLEDVFLALTGKVLRD